MPILFLIVFVDLVGFGLVIPLLPFYGERFAASPQQITMLLAIFSLMQMLASPLWGRLSDRIGRRPVLMASLAASALSYAWLGFADSLWMLFAARALAGACAGNIAAAQGYIAEVTPPEKRARGMGMIGPLTRRFGEERLMAAGLVLIGLGLLLLPFSRAVPVLAVAVSALALGMGAMQPSLNSLISQLAGKDEQGGILGVTQSIGSL